MVLGTAPPAGADPTGADPAVPDPPVAGAPPPGTTTVPLPDLGSPGTISFGRSNRDNATASVTFPVPAGMVPVELRAALELPINLRFGAMSVVQGDKTISRFGLPLRDGADVVAPLAGLQPSGGVATLNLRMTAVAQDPYCWDSDAPIRLARAAVVFTGAEAPPRSVAEFVPPVLRKVTIAIPANPSAAESTAAVRVATALARRNGQKIDVAVIPLQPGRPVVDLPAAPLEREIVVKEGPDKGLSLQGGSGVPALLVSGSGDDLAAQAQLLGNDAMAFAAGARSSAGPLFEDRLLSRDTTLKEMNNSGVTAQGTATVEINETKFGQSLRDVRLHLVGSYTPLPADAGGEVVVGIGNEVLDRWPATPDGVIDRTVAVPDRLLKRLISVQVSVRGTGEQDDCQQRAVPVRIDGSTEIDAGSANPAVPQGFQSLPQALMPSIRVGIGSDSFADTVRAVRIMVGLQRVSAVPLVTTVTTLSEALAGGGSAVLISSDGWTDPSLSLPFSANGNQVAIQGLDPNGQPVPLDLDPGNRFGSLQTVFAGARVLLVATSNGAPAQLDQLLDWLGAERGRWSDLDGQAIISMPGRDPVTVPNVAAAPSAAEPGSAGGVHAFWWVVGGAVAVAGVGLLIVRRSR